MYRPDEADTLILRTLRDGGTMHVDAIAAALRAPVAAVMAHCQLLRLVDYVTEPEPLIYAIRGGVHIPKLPPHPDRL